MVRSRAIVFDIGWVLVRLDYSRLTRFLREHGADVADMRRDRHAHRARAARNGQLPGTDLLDNLARLGTRSIDLAELRTHWDDMFELQMPMVRLAERLAERYRVHLLSNVGDLHWIHLAREFRLHRLGHGALPSFVAGVMKPDPEIYAQAERRFDLEPRATVFIDDLRGERRGRACARLAWRATPRLRGDLCRTSGTGSDRVSTLAAARREGCR